MSSNAIAVHPLYLLLVITKIVKLHGTDSSATMVPIGALRWYRFERYDGTDSSAAVVPIQALRWYRFADIIT